MSASEVLTFSSDVVDSLPLYYKALAHHLADTGRATIEPSEQTDKAKGF